MNDIEKLIEKTDHVVLLINGKAEHDIFEKRDFNEDFIDIIKTMDEIVILYERDDIKKRYEQSKRIIGEMSRIILEKEKYEHIINYQHAEFHMLQTIRFSLLNIHDIAFKINKECTEIKNQKINDMIQKISNDKND